MARCFCSVHCPQLVSQQSIVQTPAHQPLLPPHQTHVVGKGARAAGDGARKDDAEMNGAVMGGQVGSGRVALVAAGDRARVHGRVAQAVLGKMLSFLKSTWTAVTAERSVVLGAVGDEQRPLGKRRFARFTRVALCVGLLVLGEAAGAQEPHHAALVVAPDVSE